MSTLSAGKADTAHRSWWGELCYPAFALLCGLALLAWRHETLAMPPYQDQAAGYWTEAAFLADTGFDYYRLRYLERHYMDEVPGPRSYMVSVWPTLLAVLMRVFPDPAVNIVVARLFSFALGGALLALLHVLLRARLGAGHALWPVLVLATTPAFVTQVELMGLDVPLTVVMLLSAWALTAERFQTAALLGLLAFFIKATGQIMNLVGLAYCLLLLAGGPNWERTYRRRLLLGSAANLALFGLEECVLLWGDTSAALMALAPWPAILKPPRAIWVTTPDLAVLLGVSLLGFLLFLWSYFGAAGTNRDGAVWQRAAWAKVLRAEPLLAISALLVVGLLLMSRLVMYMPRYFFCGMPFLTCLWAITWLGRLRLQRLVQIALLGLVAFNLANADGRYFPSIAAWGHAEFAAVPTYAPRTCAFSERSREYLADHRATVELARKLAASAGKRPVFAESPLHFLLTNPRLGYVDRSLDSHDAVEFELALQQLLEIYGTGAEARTRPDPVFVRLLQTRTTLPGPQAADRVVWHDDLEPPMTAYVKRIPADARGNPQRLVEWFLDETWQTDWPAARLHERLGFLLRTRRFDRLRSDLDDVARRHPTDASLQRLVADGRVAIAAAEGYHPAESPSAAR